MHPDELYKENIKIPFHKIGNKLVCSDFTKANPLLKIIADKVKDYISVIGLSFPALLKYSIFHLPSLQQYKIILINSYTRLHENYLLLYQNGYIRQINTDKIEFNKTPFLCLEKN